jgi:hypothetical protein
MAVLYCPHLAQKVVRYGFFFLFFSFFLCCLLGWARKMKNKICLETLKFNISCDTTFEQQKHENDSLGLLLLIMTSGCSLLITFIVAQRVGSQEVVFGVWCFLSNIM